MTGRVLGFKEKDSWQITAVNKDLILVVCKKNLVPVVLASESVSLKWLKEYCKKRQKGFRNSESDYGKGVRNGLKYLLLACEQKAKERAVE